MRKSFTFSVLRRTLLAGAALSVCAGAAFADGGNIKVLVEAPLTGGSSSMGVSIRDGAKLAASEINKAGGVLGRQIELIERDDESKGDVGLKIAKEMAVEKISAVIGFANTGVALASNAIYQNSKIPVIVSAATGTLITHQFEIQAENFIFRMAAHDSIQAPFMVEDAIVRRGFKKPAVFGDATGYGQAGRVDLEQSLALKNMTPVMTGSFKVGDTDMTEQLQKAKAAGADVILAYGLGPELAGIVNSAANMGWKISVITPWGSSVAEFIDKSASNGNGTRMPQTFIQKDTSAKRKTFIENYIKAYNPANGRIPSPVSAAQSYDAMYVLAAAIKQAGASDGFKIRAALENLSTPVEGVVTTWTRPFTKNDHEAITSNMVFSGEVKGGRVVFADEKDAAVVNRLKNPNDKLDLYKR